MKQLFKVNINDGLRSMTTKCFRVDTMNQNIVNAEYAVRGAVVLKAME